MKMSSIKPILLAIALSSTMLEGSAAAYWSADFKNGHVPDDLMIADIMGPMPKESAYKNLNLEQAWTIGSCGSGYAAYSPSFNGSDSTPMENYMFLPFIRIEDTNAIFRWQARNMIPEIPENYTLGYRLSEDDDIIPLTGFEETSGDWETRILDLSEFAGKDLQLVICCVSADRFLLGIRDLFVGIPDDMNLSATVRTKVFAANGPATASVSVTNWGKSLSDVDLKLRVGEADDYVVKAEGEWKIGETREFTIGYNPLDNSGNQLTLTLETEDSVTLWTGTVYTSNFERRHVVDEGTGAWCVNCPEGILQLRNMARQYGDGMIFLATHITSGSGINDAVYNQNYWSGLKFYAVPYYMLDRLRGSVGSTTRNFESFYQRPTVAKIDIKGWSVEGDKLNVTTSSVFAEETSNADDEIGISYVLTKDMHRDEPNSLWFQSNSLTSPKSEQYYYLSSRIPTQLTYYSHVTLSDEHAFEPVAGSLPGSIDAMTGIRSDFSIALPDRPDPSVTEGKAKLFTDFQGMNLVVFILDKKTGEILNADTRVIDGECWADESGVELPSVSRNVRLTFSDGRILFTASSEIGDYRIELFSLDGSLLDSMKGHEAAYSMSLPVAVDGPAVIRMTSDAGCDVVKIVR